ncbi:hypothetical protein Tco_0480952 [Tanacetum coccineum]
MIDVSCSFALWKNFQHKSFSSWAAAAYDLTGVPLVALSELVHGSGCFVGSIQSSYRLSRRSGVLFALEKSQKY